MYSVREDHRDRGGGPKSLCLPCVAGMACIWSGVSSRVGGWDTMTRWKRENGGLVCWKTEGRKIHKKWLTWSSVRHCL